MTGPVTDDLRIHAADEPGPRPGGEFVLYWLQTTMRAHGNPSLNFAVEQANRLGIPVVVYHGLRPDYPWASDRIHTFIRALGIESGVRVGTQSRVPAGSGLGGSSALAVAIAAAAARAVLGRTLDADDLWPVVRDAEAQCIAVPTGVQDYLAAIHGGCWESTSIRAPCGSKDFRRIRPGWRSV